MRFFKYLIFLLIFFTNYSYASQYYLNSGSNSGVRYSSKQAACDGYGTYQGVVTSDGKSCFYSQIGRYVSIITEESKCSGDKQEFLEGFITAQDGFPPDSVCFSGCMWNSDGGGTAFDTPNGNLSWGAFYQQSTQTCSTDTPKGEDRPNPNMTECKNDKGSDSYCPKDPTKNCPANYTEQSFNNEKICVKNSDNPDEPNPNDPNNPSSSEPSTDPDDPNNPSSSQPSTNPNGSNFDDSAILNAISALATSIKNGIKSIVDAVTGSGDKVTNAVNENGDKVTNAVNENGDKVTNAVNENGDKVTNAVNANGDKIDGSVKEGNGILQALKDFFTDDELSSENDGLIDPQIIEAELQNNKVNFSAVCPSPVTEQVSILGYSWTFSFSFDMYCDAFSRLADYFFFASLLAAAFIVAGVRNG